ncbi:short-subunit dehydrogenase [Rubricella aquisinus]|uniref:Short-subunit dehydrogenase n=1 Tax=Rubricella aquisinus TaxID=2028108 RepID=A0A840X840_9RHOB|nr:SDR family oxidoreductase [Rubricella aquisinus]MBB5516887.1 short-subunit dehydrogenase [Rubricella aquisinus]
MKRILITGASSGVGMAAARRFVKAGHRVALVARSGDVLQTLADELGAQALPFPCDASDGEAVALMADQVRAAMGVPDVIINSAGAGHWKPVQDTTPIEAVEMMGAPYFAAFNVTQAFLAEMLARGSGTLIHMNSPAAIAAWPSSAGYAAARGALRSFHEALAQDLVGTGVTTTNVYMGQIDSPYFETNAVDVARLPKAGRLIRVLTVDEAAEVLHAAMINPRHQISHPPMLTATIMAHRLFPAAMRWVLRK